MINPIDILLHVVASGQFKTIQPKFLNHPGIVLIYSTRSNKYHVITKSIMSIIINRFGQLNLKKVIKPEVYADITTADYYFGYVVLNTVDEIKKLKLDVLEYLAINKLNAYFTLGSLWLSPKQSAECLGSSGFYTLTHVPTGLKYYGSTSNLYERECQHRSSMLLSKHDNRKINALSMDVNQYKFDYVLTQTLEMARLLEDNAIKRSNELQEPNLNCSPTAYGNTGVRHSDEIKAHNSKISKERWLNPEYRNHIVKKVNDFYSSPETKEQRDKLYANRKANVTPEFRTKMATIVKDAMSSQELRDRIAQKQIDIGRAKTIIIDGVEFQSINSAAKQLNMPNHVIRWRCKSNSFPTYKYV